jgi:Spy/CpxP family protein refolding chaperone
MLKLLLAASLLAFSGALLAQSTAPADAGKQPRTARYDCSQAKDPKACEERRQKYREAARKAQEACASRPEGERRDCMRAEMCKQAKDPAQCEARAKARVEKRKQRLEQNQKK